jgi:hypothetical protein
MKPAELTFERDFKTGLRYRSFFEGSLSLACRKPASDTLFAHRMQVLAPT